MEKQVAEQVLELIKEEVMKIITNINKSHIRLFHIEIFENEKKVNNFGIELKVYSEAYNLLYDENEIAYKNLKNIQIVINKYMGEKFKEKTHYFDKYDYGILHYF